MKFSLQVFLLLITYCSLSRQSHPAGEVVDTVQTNVKGQSYALYLPSTFQEDKKYPVIFFFEPLARATLPLNLYKELADKYEIILTCSNNSKNYTSALLSLDAAEAVISDVASRFQIDESLVVTSGFSGGSRVAIAVASRTELVKGVIGIGAVGPMYPSHNLRGYHKVHYAGLVGMQDFNFLEHYNGEKRFIKEGIENVRLVYNHGHQWAPVRDYEVALVWMLSKLDGEKSDSLLNASFIQDYITLLEDSVSIIDANRVRQYFISDFGLELGEPSYESSQLAKEEKQLAKIVVTEQKLRVQYQDSVNLAFKLPPNKNKNGPLNWIIDTGLAYKRRAVQSEKRNPLRADMYDRMANFIRGSTYEYSVEAMIGNNYPRAFIAVEIWSSMIEDERWEYWMKCKLHAMNKNIPLATRYLEKLIKTGFENGKALKADSSFNVLSGTRAYIQLTSEDK